MVCVKVFRRIIYQYKSINNHNSFLIIGYHIIINIFALVTHYFLFHNVHNLKGNTQKDTDAIKNEHHAARGIAH